MYFLTSRDSCYQSFDRSRERLGTRCAIVSLRRAYPETPYEVVELASFKHTLEMAVKTKRSSVRTALLASASLALVRGAQAAPAFANSVPSGTASGSECAALRFDATSGALLAIDNANYGAGLAAAVPLFGATDPATAFEDCKVASGYYLAAGAAGSDDGANLVVKKVPADFYSTVTSAVEVLLYAASPGTWDGVDASALAGTGVTKCPFSGTTSAIGSDAQSDCTPSCPIANGLIAALDSTTKMQTGTCECAEGFYGPSDLTISQMKCLACPTGTTVDQGDTAGEVSCKTLPGYYLKTPGDEDTQATTTAATVWTTPPVVAQVPAASRLYSAGGATVDDDSEDIATWPTTDADLNTAAGLTGIGLCPFQGTIAAAGGSAVEQCTPDCGTDTGAEAKDGDCVVSPGHILTKVVAPGASQNIADAETRPIRVGENFFAWGGKSMTSGTPWASGAPGSTHNAAVCPNDGTVTALASSVNDCTPASCDANEVVVRGKCVCAAGYYYDNFCRKCDAHFTSAAGSTGEAACLVPEGYYISDASGPVTVSQVPAGKYFASPSTVNQDVGPSLQADLLQDCPANSNSPAGSAQIGDCVCDDGYVAGLGAQQCVSFSVTATAAATPAAASAGASTPIAVALAAAAAVPLLL